jgi:hypothetical protein
MKTSLDEIRERASAFSFNYKPGIIHALIIDDIPYLLSRVEALERVREAMQDHANDGTIKCSVCEKALAAAGEGE